MRVTLLLFVFMGVALAAASQTSPLNRSLQLYKAGDLQHAKEVIDSAMKIAEYQQSATAWYVQGFIYKDLFKASPRTASPYREKAIESFTKLRELDKEQKFAKETVQNLRFLGASYYNEGMGFIEQGRYDDAVKSYEKFEQVASTLKDTDLNSPDKKISFQLALGSAITRSGKENKQEKPAVKAVTCFEKVLAIDSLNREANYNIAVIHYNEAVSRILSLDYDALNFENFSSFEDEVIKQFNKSLPYMKRAYRANPKDPNTLEGLAGIYFGLRDFEASNQYKQQLNLVSKH